MVSSCRARNTWASRGPDLRGNRVAVSHRRRTTAAARQALFPVITNRRPGSGAGSGSALVVPGWLSPLPVRPVAVPPSVHRLVAVLGRAGAEPPAFCDTPQISREHPPAFSPEEITQAAVDLADRDGLAAVSMRRIAERVGSAPTSQYWYVSTKEEIYELDEASQVKIPSSGTPYPNASNASRAA